MASSPKTPQKSPRSQLVAVPKLQPRQTATSMARAARQSSLKSLSSGTGGTGSIPRVSPERRIPQLSHSALKTSKTTISSRPQSARAVIKHEDEFVQDDEIVGAASESHGDTVEASPHSPTLAPATSAVATPAATTPGAATLAAETLAPAAPAIATIALPVATLATAAAEAAAPSPNKHDVHDTETAGDGNNDIDIDIDIAENQVIQVIHVDQTDLEKKKEEFLELKMDLDLRQQKVMQMFTALKQLQQVSRGGAGAGERAEGGECHPADPADPDTGTDQEELLVLNVGDWSVCELQKLCREAHAHAHLGLDVGPALPFSALNALPNESKMDEACLKLGDMSDELGEVCLRALSQRQELFDWVRTHAGVEESEEFKDVAGQFSRDSAELLQLLHNVKQNANDTVNCLSHLSKQALRERSTLINTGEALVREVARLKASVAPPRDSEFFKESSVETGDYDYSKDMSDFKQMKLELEAERTQRAALKQKYTAAESQIKMYKNRLAKKEKELKESDTQIEFLTNTMKTLEDQKKQRESNFESQARKLREAAKTGEVTVQSLTQQKENFEARIKELEMQLDTSKMIHQNTVDILNRKVQELEEKLVEQQQLKEHTISSLEHDLSNAQANIIQLEEKVSNFENCVPKEITSQQEMNHWAELQAKDEVIRLMEEEISSTRRELARVVETVTKASKSDDHDSLKQKLAAELLAKEEVVGRLQDKLRELTKLAKVNEKKLECYSQQVEALKVHIAKVAARRGHSDELYTELHSEVTKLNMLLVEAEHRNVELAGAVAARDTHIEQQEKMFQELKRNMKMREELISMLKKTEADQQETLQAVQADLEARMKIVDDVNKQIAAKASEVSELVSVVDTKRTKIQRLEKIVLTLEEQQRRAQVQRTRYEQKIATLEHELAALTDRSQQKRFFFF